MNQKNNLESIDPKELFLHDGDVLFIFNPSLIGQLRKVITRKSFTGAAIYFDVQGLGMLVVNHGGRITLMRLDEFLKMRRKFLKVSTVWNSGYMKRILQSLGKKKEVSQLAGELLELREAPSFKPDDLFEFLKK